MSYHRKRFSSEEAALQFLRSKAPQILLSDILDGKYTFEIGCALILLQTGTRFMTCIKEIRTGTGLDLVEAYILAMIASEDISIDQCRTIANEDTLRP